MLRVEFLDSCDLRLLPDGYWSVLRDMHVRIYDSVDQTVVTIPTGFETDLATVPRVPGVYLLAGGKGRRAAVLHDYLYWGRSCSRAWCDKVFYAALATEEPWWRRALMYIGVRIGGWLYRR